MTDMAGKDLDKLIDELRRRTPDLADDAEADAEELVNDFGSVEDALLYLEWAERSQNESADGQARFFIEISRRAKGTAVVDEIQSMLPDIRVSRA
jgi:hypothetical protein